MNFPCYIHIGPLSVHPHLLFESLAYFIGFNLYLITRRKDRMPVDKSMWVVAGAIVGAAAGSKILYWFEDPVKTLHNAVDFVYLMEGKSIVGGLLGGLIGVEITKKRIGWSRSTGDDFALPLIVGMSIGRIGCFLTGLSDHTHGIGTTWITGVDFGDGIPRHPAQLYEIAFLLLLGIILIVSAGKSWFSWEGGRFQLFMLGYLGFRLAVDFIKPTPRPYLSLNNVQVACIAGLLYYGVLVARKRRESLKAHHAQQAIPIP